MNDYTPTTGDLRVAWVAHHIESCDESPMPMSDWEAQFDRGIEAVRAESAALERARIVALLTYTSSSKAIAAIERGDHLKGAK